LFGEQPRAESASLCPSCRRLRRGRKGKTAPPAPPGAACAGKRLVWGAGMGAAVVALASGLLVLAMGSRSLESTPANGADSDLAARRPANAQTPADHVRPGSWKGEGGKPATGARSAPAPGELAAWSRGEPEERPGAAKGARSRPTTVARVGPAPGELA